MPDAWLLPFKEDALLISNKLKVHFKSHHMFSSMLTLDALLAPLPDSFLIQLICFPHGALKRAHCLSRLTPHMSRACLPVELKITLNFTGVHH